LETVKDTRKSPQDAEAGTDASALLLNSLYVGADAFLDTMRFRSEESALEAQSALLLENIDSTLTIHAEMFRRILETTPRPSPELAELLADTGNRYLNLSELVSLLCKHYL